MSNPAIDLFAAFATDETKEQDGTLTQLPGCGDTQFRIAREGNKAYAKMLQKAYKANRAVLDSKGDAAEAKSDQIMVDVLASTILLGWEGKVRYQGKDLEYSKDNARMLLKHKGFQAKVLEVAGSIETFKVVTDEEKKKNSTGG